MEKELGKIDTEIEKLDKKLNNQGFVGKAPAAVIEKVKDQHQALVEKKEKMTLNLEKIQSIERT